MNCVGTFLFTKVLRPRLIAATGSVPPDIVRVVWSSSIGLQQFALEGCGIDTDNMNYHIPKSHVTRSCETSLNKLLATDSGLSIGAENTD
jgi:hypothetical protein